MRFFEVWCPKLHVYLIITAVTPAHAGAQHAAQKTVVSKVLFSGYVESKTLSCMLMNGNLIPISQ
jgi:hypothetical protein